METFLVQLEPNDDVLSVRDKISWGRARRVLLAWPRRARVLERRVDLLLLLRYCQSLGAQMAVVSPLPEVRANARALGVSVFRTVAQAQKQPWRSVVASRVFWLAARQSAAQRSAVLGDPRSRRAALRDQAELPVGQRLGWFFTALLALAALLVLLAPTVVVTLPLERREQALEITGWADPNLAAPNPAGGLPASWLEVTVEGRAQAPVSGLALAPDDFAEGSVTLTNTGESEVIVPRGSVLLAGDRRYTTTIQAQLAAGAALNVTVRADRPGSAGNAPAGALNTLQGPLSFTVRAHNARPLAGGSERLAPAPDAAEAAALRDMLMNDLRASARNELTALAGEERLLLEYSLEEVTIIEEQQDPPTGQPGHRLNLALQVQFRALAVSRAHWQALARAALDANLPEGWRAASTALRLDPPAPGKPVADGAGWRVTARRTLEPAWDAETMALTLRGRSIEQAAALLAQTLPLAQPPRISAFPAWWPIMPLLPARIQWQVTE